MGKKTQERINWLTDEVQSLNGLLQKAKSKNNIRETNYLSGKIEARRSEINFLSCLLNDCKKVD